MSKLPENPNSDQTTKPAPTAPAAPVESPSSPAPATSSPSLPSPSPATPSASPTTPAVSAPSTNPAPQAPAASVAPATPVTQPAPAAPTPTPSPTPTATPTNTTASSIPAASTASAAPVASTSSTPSTSPSAPVAPANINFSADKIGQWAAKQEKPFAAQNQKEKAEKAKRTHARKKALPFIIICIVLVLLLIGGIITLIIALNNPSSKVEAPEIYGSSDNDIYEYQDALSKVYQDNDNNLDAVSEAVDKTLATESGQANVAQVRLGEAYFYGANAEYQRAIDALANVEPSRLSLDQQIMYYDTLYLCNMFLGNGELADEYGKKVYELKVELGGEGG